MTRTPRSPGTATARDFAAGDRVRVREGVTGGVAPGDCGTVHTVGPLGAERPVRVHLDGDGPEPRGFDVDELERIEAVEQ
jgi:hypothetical protein